MKRKTRILAVMLALVLLLAALPVHAADSAMLMKQVSAKLALLSEPKSGAQTLMTISKNDAVLTLGTTGGYTLAEAGGKQGYVETKALKKPSSSANVKGIAHAATDAALYDAVEGTIIAIADAGSVFTLLCEGVDWLAMRRGGTVYYAKRKALEVYNAASSATQYALMKKSTSIYDGSGKGAKRIATASKGELISILASLSDTTAIVKKGAATVGIASLSSAELYTAGANSASVTVTSAATLYRGAGAKQAKLGTVKKGATLEKLGEYGDYSIVNVNGLAACVTTKSLQQAPAAATPPPSSGPINTSYVEFTQRASVYAAPGTSGENYGAMPAGSVVRCYGTTKDGLWVNIQVHKAGHKGYVERQYVKEKDIEPEDVAQVGSDNVAEFIAYINAYRKAADVKALSVSDALMRAAAIRVEELTRRFSHLRPDGTDCNTVDPANIFGENIAMGITMPTAESAAKSFMSSPDHKENLLRSSFTKTGAACLKVGDVYYWVQLFG